MSQNAVNRIDVLEKLKRKEIDQVTAASLLHLTPRQVRRVMKRYRKEGVKALIHGNRGKVSNRAISETEKERVLTLFKEKYADFGPTLAWEKLVERDGAACSLPALRNYLIAAKLWHIKSRRVAVIHPLRERLPLEGQLIQTDGSPFDWFEHRFNPVTNEENKMCNLTVAIDDATSKLKALHFDPQETTNAYYAAFKPYLEKEGKPLALYVDHNSIFTINASEDAKRMGSKPSATEMVSLTQFERAMKTLGVKIILAPTPQAKGRVERVNQTLQDRLTKELRLRNISDMETANQFLPKFMEWFNSRFAVPAKSLINAHRPLLPTEDLEAIFTHQEKRVLSQNLTCQYHQHLYQITEKRPSYALRGAIIMVREDMKGRISLMYHGKALSYSEIERLQPKHRLSIKQLDLIARENTVKTYWEQVAINQWRDYGVI